MSARGCGIGRSLVLAAGVFAIITLALQADAEIGGPCAETIRKHCKEVVPGGGRIVKCLNDHRDDQSIACRDWLEDQQKRMKELNVACSEEIAVLCNIDPPDSALVYQCLNSNYSSLKVDCRTKFSEIRNRLRE